MRLDAHCDPITEDDSFIVQALDDAEVHPLLVAVAYTTGDLSLLEEEFRPDPTRVLEPGAGLEADVQTRARARAAEALGRHRDAGSPAPVGLGPDELRTLIAFLVGAEDLDRYLPLLEEELSLDGVDHRAPSWHKDDIASDRAFTVAVIGAGMSGIVIAHRLAQAGVDFVILEKNAEVGGTWLENTYPGCRVDVANHLYSYSFAQTGDWPG
ncbi:MAG: FAD-dependent oxidoreductase, partial [Acidimicrobiales bacterium]